MILVAKKQAETGLSPLRSCVAMNILLLHGFVDIAVLFNFFRIMISVLFLCFNNVSIGN